MPASHIKTENRDGNWLFIVAVQNVRTTADLKHELTIDRVTFISGKKLRRISKRLNLDASKLKQNEAWNEFIHDGGTYAFLFKRGTPASCKDECFQLVQEELELLSSTQLFYRLRNSACKVSIHCEETTCFQKHVFISDALGGLFGSQRIGNPFPILLDNQWKVYHKETYFGLFLKHLRTTTSGFSSPWLKTIRRAIRLIGKSQNEREVATAFLWNMIALEILLTQQGDSYVSCMVNRIEAIVGWIDDWNEEGYKAKIENIYKLRCKVVHDGRLDLVRKCDLDFADFLLNNVLYNVLRHPKIFPNKQALISFSERVTAEILIGSRKTVRPKTLRLIKRLK